MPRDNSSPAPELSDWAAAAGELAPMIGVWRQLLTDHVPNTHGRCQACTQGGTGIPRQRDGRAAHAESLKRPLSVTPSGSRD